MLLAGLGLPSIDKTTCGSWTEQDIDTYHKLPYWFRRKTGDFQKYWTTWDKLLPREKWEPGQGEYMKAVGIEPSPVLRQQAFPSALRDTPTADVVHTAERESTTRIYRHRFVSEAFNFLPAFQDFITDKIEPNRKNLNKQVMIYAEQYYRTYMWHHSPYVYVCGQGLIDGAPVGDGNTAGTSGKTTAWLATNVFKNNPTPLTAQEIFNAIGIFKDEVGATPFEGTTLPSGDSSPLTDKYCLVGDSEVWRNMINEAWVKQNRPLNLNIITQGFRGDLFGEAMFRHERYGIRFKVDPDNFNASYPAPEVRRILPDTNDPEHNRTMPNPDYTKIANSQYALAWLVGGESYNIINPGPPPADFSKDVDSVMGMDWNGRVRMTKNFLIPCVDGAGNDQLEMNATWGEKLRLQAQLAVGINGFNRFNVMPIIYLRQRGITTE